MDAMVVYVLVIVSVVFAMPAVRTVSRMSRTRRSYLALGSKPLGQVSNSR